MSNGRRARPARLPSNRRSLAFYWRWGAVTSITGQFKPLPEQVQQKQCPDVASAIPRTACRHNVRSNANSFLANDLKSLDQRNTLGTNRIHLLGVSHALSFTHQPNFLGFSSTGSLYVARLAFTLSFALLRALAGDLDAYRSRHQIALIVRLSLGLFELDAALFCFSLCVEHILPLFSKDLLSLSLHQLFRQMNVADQHIDHVDVILQQVRTNARFGTFLFFVTILQVSHRGRFRRLVSEDRIDERMHHVLYQPVDRTDLSDHKRSVFGFDAEHDAYFQLHCEAVLGYNLERVEGVCHLSRSPLDRLVSGRYYDRCNRQSVDVVSARTDNRFLNAAKSGRHYIGLVRPRIEPQVRGVIQGQILLYLCHRVLVVKL